LRTKSKREGVGFNPKQSARPCLVTVPASNRDEGLMSGHFSDDQARHLRRELQTRSAGRAAPILVGALESATV
jgi:hypothetical protein